MAQENIHCLYCDSENSVSNKICSHCGMALPDCHPHSSTYRRGSFKWAFWGIVIFCLIMMYYLPR